MYLNDLTKLPDKIADNPTLLKKYKIGRWISSKEGELILDIIKTHNIQNYYESGTANGYSAMWASLYCLNVETYDIVDRPKIYTEIDWEKPICFKQTKFSTIKKILHPAFIFIDGDHETSDVLEDWNSIKDLIQQNDIVAFHDIHYDPVKEALSTISYKDIEIKDKIGILYV